MGVGVKGTSLLVDKASVFGSSKVKVVSCPVGTMTTFLGVTDVCTDVTVMGSTELLGVLLVGEAGGLCGELVQKVVGVGEIIFSIKETGKGDDVGMLCTLSPVEEPVQKWLMCENLRGKVVLQFSFCIIHPQL